MPPTEARFSARASGPFVRDFYNIVLDLSANTGQIEFNGYFYTKAEELLIESWLTVFEPGPEIVVANTGTEDEVIELTADITSFRPIQPTHYRRDTVLHRLYVRIIRKEEFEDTSEYWDDPEEGMMCLFPTNRLRLTFAILPPPVPQPQPQPSSFRDLGGMDTDGTVEELE